MKKLPLVLIILALLGSCKNKGNNKEEIISRTEIEKYPKFSLAQWSFNRELFNREMTNQDFIIKAAEMGFEGVEYVSQFFQDNVDNYAFLDSLNAVARESGIKNLLVMVDGAGMLGSQDEKTRNQSVTAHKKWIDATSYLGCNFMRINAHGDGAPDKMMMACQKSIAELADYGAQKEVTIVVENHGGVSNDGSWLKELLTRLNDKKVASLPDFDNWCIERENGQLWGAPCIKEYPRYQGMKDLLPFARAISVKAFEFDETGDETTIDFKRMFELIDQYNYSGYLGIEYEGHTLSSEEGINKTRHLAEKYFIND